VGDDPQRWRDLVTHSAHKSKLARRVTRLENRHLRMMTQLHNEIRALEVKLTTPPALAKIMYRHDDDDLGSVESSGEVN
jgi:hypothetical protein